MTNSSLDSLISILSQKYRMIAKEDIVSVAQSIAEIPYPSKAMDHHVEIARCLDSWGLEFSGDLLLKIAGRGSKPDAMVAVRQSAQNRFLAAKKLRNEARRNPDPVVASRENSFPSRQWPDADHESRTESSPPVSPGKSAHAGTNSAGRTMGFSATGSYEMVPGKPGLSRQDFSEAKGQRSQVTSEPVSRGNRVEQIGSSDSSNPANHRAGDSLAPSEREFLQAMILQLQDLVREMMTNGAKPAPAANSVSKEFETRLFESMGSMSADIRSISGTMGWLKSTIDTERQLRRHLQERGPLPEAGLAGPGAGVSKQLIGGLVTNLSRQYYGREDNPVRSESEIDRRDEPGQISE